MSLNEDKILFKTSIKQACLEAITSRINNAKTAMEQAQETANTQDKSSAGDKYETARAMGQLDRDMNARQLEQALNEHALLQAIETDTLQSEINTGCVFELEDTVFFIAAGLGTVVVNNKPVIVISPQSPFFLQARLKKVGDEIIFKSKIQKIISVF